MTTNLFSQYELSELFNEREKSLVEHINSVFVGNLGDLPLESKLIDVIAEHKLYVPRIIEEAITKEKEFDVDRTTVLFHVSFNDDRTLLDYKTKYHDSDVSVSAEIKEYKIIVDPKLTIKEYELVFDFELVDDVNDRFNSTMKLLRDHLEYITDCVNEFNAKLENLATDTINRLKDRIEHENKIYDELPYLPFEDKLNP